MIELLISWLEDLSNQVSVPLFVFIGSLVEEVIAPIPSPLVMLLAGSIAKQQDSSLLFIILLATIGAISKTVGSLLIYIISDKAEDVVIDKFGKFIGVSHSDTEGLGSFFGQGKRDDIAIFLLRAIPIIPTAPVSVISGLIKIDLKTYLVCTFFGLMVRNMIYLYFGYTSLGAVKSAAEGFDSLEKIGYLILASLVGLILVWMYRKRRQGSILSVVNSIIERGKDTSKK